ncbi:MAG: hypothetical protein F4155_00325 [Acidimicrobiales bacterium]|nr:hypothetical protein [Acidimicrobiales bacterium]MYG60349.1 hypothetical protein [Acidimicrobiales bacterium]MYH73228.1 hypothetical protein [Acidimicrobiales bacterium]MYK71526.1 hypothetical protein [Acidimicrobiales bacterium]
MATGPGVRVTRAARRHGISDQDIWHAYRDATTADFGDDGFIMIAGGRQDGSPLEAGFRATRHQRIPDTACNAGTIEVLETMTKPDFDA